jgi:hypothetical protein
MWLNLNQAKEKEMPIAIFEVGRYWIRVSREMNMKVDGLNLKIRGLVQMEAVPGGGGYVAQAFFLDDTSPVPNNSFNEGNGIGNLFLPRWQFEWFVDLLRNESPIHVLLDPVAPRRNMVFSGGEPPGEGELNVRSEARPLNPREIWQAQSRYNAQRSSSKLFSSNIRTSPLSN